MVTVGIDAHKRSHTAVAVDEAGRKLGQHTCGTTSEDHLALLNWAGQSGDERLWAIEDCRHLSRRLERDLLGAGERIVRVPTKLMAHVLEAARSYGKSDPIDALAVARAAQREPLLPTADNRSLDGHAIVLRPDQVLPMKIGVDASMGNARRSAVRRWSSPHARGRSCIGDHLWL